MDETTFGFGHFAVYLVVFAVLWFGAWRFSRRLGPPRKKYWHPRITLLVGLVLGPFFVVPFLGPGRWSMALLSGGFLILILYLNITKVRVCERCGFVAQPQQLVIAARHCPKCGEALTRERLFPLRGNRSGD